MNFTFSSQSLTTVNADAIVVPVYEDASVSPAAAEVDNICGGLIRTLIDEGDCKGKVGSTLWLPLNNAPWKRLLIVGAGKSEECNDATLRKVLTAAIKILKESTATSALFCLGDIAIPGRNAEWLGAFASETLESGMYQFTELKSKQPEPAALTNIIVHTQEGQEAAMTHALTQGAAIARGAATAKTLANLPGNICTPTYLADKAEQLATEYPCLKTQVLDEAQMEQLGMGSLLAVAQGSEQPATLVVVSYQGAAPDSQPHVLVGKGITFDTGGISLKPGEAMDEMKFDMCGAASVLGTLQAIAEIQPKLNVVGIIACAENMPGGRAIKPGDIVKSLSGQTIEILNTDAEGRLVLCDALTYAERFNPASVVDIATLTGACVIALGAHATGLLANDDALADELLSAGQLAGDRAWRLPLWDEYQSQLDSNFADMQNIGGRPGGTITAACFLSRFAKNFKWAHLDIAGTAWNSGKEKGATGRPVPLLTRYLLNKA